MPFQPDAAVGRPARTPGFVPEPKAAPLPRSGFIPDAAPSANLVTRTARVMAEAPLSPIRGVEALRNVFKEVASPFNKKVEKVRAVVAPPIVRASEPVFEAIKFAQDRIPQNIRGVPTVLAGIPPRLPGTPETQAKIAGRIASESAVPSALDLIIMAGAEGVGVGVKSALAASRAAKAATEARVARRIQEGVAVPPAPPTSIPPDVTAGVEAAGAGSRPPSFWQTLQTHLTRSGETTLKGQGAAGEELANTLMRYASDREVYAGTHKAPFFNDLLALNPAEKDAFREFLDKGLVTQDLTPRARMAAEKAKAVLEEQGKMLEEFSQKHGVTVDTPEGEQFFHRRKDFFPHEVDWTRMATPDGRAEEIANLVRTGQVKTPEVAAEAVDAMLARQTTTVDPADLLQMRAPSKRLAQELKGRRTYDLVSIVKDPVVALDNHFRRLGNSLAKVELFGKDYEKLYDMISRISAEGGDAESAGAIALHMVGFDKQGNKALRSFLREVKGFEALKLGTAFVANAPQGLLNSWIRSGSFKAASKGFRDLFTKGGQDFAMKAGISSRNVEKYIQDSVGALTGERGKGFFPKVSGFILEKITPFKQSEVANRVVAANAGRYYLQDRLVPMFLRDPANPKILREIKNFGLNPAAVLSRGGVSEGEVLTAANIFAQRRTQFMNDALSMPIFSQDPWGRLVYLFKTFSFQQGKMLKEAMQIHGVLPTAARLGIAATVIGIPVAKLRGILSAHFATDEKQGGWASDFLSGLAAVGGLGLISDAFKSAKYGTEGAMGSIAGPVVQDLGEGLVSLRKATEGDFGYGLNQIIRRVPVVGPAVRNIMKGQGIFAKGRQGRPARRGR